MAMFLGGVHIPADVLTAWEEQRLVIFTGAGVSMSPPSSLPNFAGLAAEVASILQSPLNPEDDEWKDQLDTFMDVMNEDDGVDVHRLVQGIVTKKGSAPNANHDALARIASKFSTRVITTNYDLHLETALRAHNDGLLDVFRAPAMPLGDDFEGLVYLHGSAEDDPRRLVVTDRDFSHAYFHSAWAARFLERMFREYVVLFVGYSHSDVVMKYLGLGLGPKSKRYVLTDSPDLAIWKRLHVAPLEYPPGRHDVLTNCLTAWADHGARGLLEHRQRIRELVSIASKPTPEELSYLEDSVQRPDRIAFFCEFATDNVWLEWAAQQEPFKKLFDRSALPDAVMTQLAQWFARDFALVDDTTVEDDERRSVRAWRVFAEAGGVLSTTAWNAVGHGLLAFSGARPEHVLRWLWVLMEQEHAGCQDDFLDYALEYAEVWDEQALRLALLAHLMAPRLVPETGWGTARMGVKTRDLHWLDEAWKKYEPDLDALAPVVFPVVEAALLKHLNLEARVGATSSGFNRRRSAIQPHGQDRYRDPIDAVIDAVRDTTIAIWSTDTEFVNRLIERWLISEHVLMRRIAVHVAGQAPGATGSDLVRFVLDHDLASATGLAQEVLHLLGAAAPEADAELIYRLVDAWTPASDDERDWYRAFSRLESLERNGVDNAHLTATLAEVRSQLREGLQGSPYPGMSSWMEVGSGDGVQPLTVEAFDERVRGAPDEAVQFVLGFEERTFPRSGETTREEAAQMLRDTVLERPGAGLELWPYLNDHPDLQGMVIAAWGQVKESDDLDAIMNVLAQADLGPVLQSVGQFLIHAERSDGAPWESLPATETFMKRLWAACATEAVYEPGSETNQHWVSKTINEPAGVLMEFWFEMFRRRWAAAGDDWRGMSEPDKTFLEQALDDRTERGALAQTQIAGRLHFLDAADSPWCRSRVLPLRNWTDPLVAEPFWWGVLSYARWNDGLVADGLLAGLIETAKHLDAFDDDQARRWAGLLASIAVRCETPPASSWVDEMTAKAGPDERARWIEELRDELEEVDPAVGAAVWDTWLAEYWTRRTRRIPAVLSQAEADALAVLAPHLPAEQFVAAVTLVEATSAGLDSHGEASRHVSDDLIDACSVEVGRFLTHLIKNTSGQFWGGYDLVPKLKRLVAKPGDWKSLREAALRLSIDLP